MKKLSQILARLRSLPEGLRKLLAGVSIIIFTMLIFNSWGNLIFSRVNEISYAPETKPPFEQKTSDEEKITNESSVLSPAAGIFDSLRNLKELIPPEIMRVAPPRGALTNENILLKIKRFLNKILEYILNSLR